MSNLDRFFERKRAIFGDTKKSEDNSNRLQELVTKAATGTNPGDYQMAEVTRIVQLPLVLPMSDAEFEDFQYKHVQAPALREGFRLFRTQADMVNTYEKTGGGFFPVGVGWGKTLATLMIAQKAWDKGLRKMVLLIPPQVVTQLRQTDIKWARQRVAIQYPIHFLHGRGVVQREAMTKSGRVGLYVMPYSYLSTKDTTAMLEAIEPEIVIADEAHNLARRNSARTKRMMHYIETYSPEGVCLSGTITSKSVHDYYHLIRWSCGQDNPLPNAATLAQDWGNVLDAEVTAGGIYEVASAGTKTISPLLNWARQHFPRETFDYTVPSFRKAYSHRMNTSPRVVSSGDADIGVSLTLHNEPVRDHKKHADWPKLEELLLQVTDEWKTPNGDEIEHAIHTWKWLNELSAGFYNELFWTDEDTLAKRRAIPVSEAASILERAKIRHAARQEYSKELRRWLEDVHIPKLDTPFLVESSMAQHGDRDVASSVYQLWKQWHSYDFPGCPDRESRAVRICDYKIKRAVHWAENAIRHGGAILWVHHIEVGEWLMDELVAAGLRDRAVHCPAGPIGNERILDPANGDKIIVASINGHGTGKNLQHFSQQCYVQWPRQATLAEQSLGRTHRNGQKADELIVHTMNTLDFDDVNFAACLNDALYIHQTTDNRQKVIYASYDPPPKIFPSLVLMERGLNAKILTKDQEKALYDKFVGDKT